MGDDRQIEAKLQRNFHLLALFSTKTTGQIFTKILHYVVALVALLNHVYKPVMAGFFHPPHGRGLHYGNNIWLPWQRPLTSWKIRYRSIIGT